MAYFSTPAIWRNGITNTSIVVDLVRKRHEKLARSDNKAFAAFCADLDAEMEAWFRRSRSAAPESYEEAEQVWQDHIADAGKAGHD